MPTVHADDVSDAIGRELERRIGGAFNLAAGPPITTGRIADALGPAVGTCPRTLLRPLMSGARHTRLQQVDTCWLDMAFALPLLDSSRARVELDWSPALAADSVLRAVLSGMRDRASDSTPVLRPRRVLGALRRCHARPGRLT